MIQRIQTFYLFVVAVLFTTMIFTPLADFSKGEIQFLLTNTGIIPIEGGEPIVQTFLLTILEVIILVLSIIAIFLYKKRILQMRIVLFNLVLMIGFYALLGVYLYVAKNSVGLDFHFHLPIVFPLIGAILNYLAIRAIGKDEALVRSLNHLR